MNPSQGRRRKITPFPDMFAKPPTPLFEHIGISSGFYIVFFCTWTCPQESSFSDDFSSCSELYVRGSLDLTLSPTNRVTRKPLEHN